MRPLWDETEGRLTLSPLYLLLGCVLAGALWLALYGTLWLAVAIGRVIL